MSNDEFMLKVSPAECWCGISRRDLVKFVEGREPEPIMRTTGSWDGKEKRTRCRGTSRRRVRVSRVAKAGQLLETINEVAE